MPEEWELCVSDADARLRLAGDVTAAVAAELRDAAVELIAGDKPMVVDCSAVTRLDASAAQVLIALKRKARAASKPCSVAGASDEIVHLLQCAGLESAVS